VQLCGIQRNEDRIQTVLYLATFLPHASFSVTPIVCRYASLFFIACIGKEDNELVTLEVIHRYVEILDKYFGNVCELDIIFNFHKVCAAASVPDPNHVRVGLIVQAYYILDEVLLGGELQETSSREVLRIISTLDDKMIEDDKIRR
jgi:AP-1 complex subunit sigma 1/2